MAYAESTQANSCLIVTVQDNHLSNVTSDHFFLTPKWKKTCLKQQLQNFIEWRNVKKNQKEQCIKNKRLSDYIYSIANL